MIPTLHLLVGLPGSGKTTLGKLLQELTGATRLSSDEYRLTLFPEPEFSQQEHDNLYSMLDHNVEHLLERGYGVIYDANLNRKTHRNEKYTLAKKHNAKVILWWVQTPKELAKKRRVEDQDHRLIPDGETSEKMFDRIESVFEPPEADEPCIKIDGTTITKENVKVLLAQQN